ncbi:MAG: zinc-binding dehydrogenase [SAR324 cluster bacterium]|nr:zinc-binding dehydrogenase [SAR324 cluster bacterium]
MKAMVLKSANTPFELVNLPDPSPGPGEAVARVISCGSGLTIHHVRAGRMLVDYPRVIGHEISGEIVAIGSDSKGLSIGDPVTAYFYLTCGRCYWCRINRETLCEDFGGYIGRDLDGGYAEYLKLPVQNFIKLPEALDITNHPAEVGVITDAIATPVKVLKKARIAANDTVAVFGAGGGLGIHMLMLARWAHARVIAVDIAQEKFEACRQAGADDVVDASKGNAIEALNDLTKGAGVDVAIDFVSSKLSLETAISALGKGGRLLTLGGSGEAFQAHAKDFLNKELELLGSRYATKQEVIDSLNLVARGEVWPLVSETYKLEEAETVHKRLDSSLITGRAAVLID